MLVKQLCLFKPVFIKANASCLREANVTQALQIQEREHTQTTLNFCAHVHQLNVVTDVGHITLSNPSLQQAWPLGIMTHFCLAKPQPPA